MKRVLSLIKPKKHQYSARITDSISRPLLTLKRTLKISCLKISTQFKSRHITRRVTVLHNFPQPAEPVSHRLGDIQPKDSFHLALLETAAIVSSPERRIQLSAIGFSSQTLQQVLFHCGCCNNAVPKEWCSHKPIIPFHCEAVLFISYKERNICQKNADRS